jgi:thiamine-phosphate pyrophosphorylase
LFPSLYAILDPSSTNESVISIAEKLSAAGVKLFQLRDKHASGGKLYSQALELLSILKPCGARLIVNDRADIAAMSAAGGVHVGQEDLPVEDARAICASPSWVGVSTHNIEQLREAVLTSADYIAVGPIFATSSKQNHDPVVGLDLLRQARNLTRKPLVAIGGITIESAADVFGAGADSVAVIRDLAGAADPAARAQEFIAIAERARAKKN